MNYQDPVYIVAAMRSPIGRLGGALQTVNAVELATQVAQRALTTVPSVDQAILGHVLQAGTGMNVARQVVLRTGLPQSIPAFTVNMVCGSGLKAVALGADAISGGEAGIVLAGGVESMSNAPHYAHIRGGQKFGDAPLADAILADGLTDPLLRIHMGETAEKVAEKYGVSREEQDRFALRSQQRAVAAQSSFEREIVPIETRRDTVNHDEHPRADTTLEKLASLKPAFRPEGTVTAGNASGINDGSAAIVLASHTTVQQHNLTPRARIVASTATGCDPSMMGLGPVGAIRKLCEQTGWNLAEVDAIEINEAFAAQSLACQRELGIRDDQLNLRGGAIALGHPIGASGARVLVTLLHLLEDNNWQRGIASLCVGGGMGIAMAIERF
jgi:acetyl-CoA C-acetyltransferase